MHIFSDDARFSFVKRLLQKSMIQAKILGEMFEMNLSWWSVGHEDQKMIATNVPLLLLLSSSVGMNI